MNIELRWLLWRQVVVLAVVLLISMAELTTSQSTDRNYTMMSYYCSSYQSLEEKYFLSNLNATLYSMRKQVSISRYATAQTLLNGVSVWGRSWCRGYLSIPDCLDCFDSAVAMLKKCGLHLGGHAMHSDCDVRYEDHNFYTEFNDYTSVVSCNNITSSQPIEYRKATEKLLLDLQIAAPRALNFYAISERQLDDDNTTVYAIAQCTLNISQGNCLECLKSRVRSLQNCLPSTSGQEIDNGCFMRYSQTPFFGQNQNTDITSLVWDDEPDLKGAFIYNYKDLELATNNFSQENIIGKGGFGEVFKAVLDDNKVVAIKKLNVEHGRAMSEFQNEALIVANIHHRNLLRLYGWSSNASNLLLVLEYMPNGSLDKFLWGAKRGTLNWKQRFDIILGIARALVHLHGEFHVKIIHRDIKSSNILLDDDFQPKIADFGLARLQSEDQSQVITKFAGTLGYTAPEYALCGLLSEKVDTFSFGIVILEVISGQRCTEMNFDSSSTEFLLERAWKLYENNNHIKLIDETMDVNQYEQEQVANIIEIALLCTQSPVSKRPTMSQVVSMLPHGLSLEERQLQRPTFINYKRRIRAFSSENYINIDSITQY